jgi:ATP-binding protein involved in chromosome partitioning
MSQTEETIRAALRSLIDPITGQDVVSAALIAGIMIRGGHVGLMLQTSREYAAARAPLQAAIQSALLALDGVTQVTPVMTAESAPSPATSVKSAVWNLAPIANVQRVIAVASGKGGVGKSAVTAALALSHAARGLHVGILDADIYGPSIPHLLGIANAGKPALNAENKMIPHRVYGVQCMSVGLILEAGQAAIMRGAMVSKTLQQLMRGTAWGSDMQPLDILFMDMPPGTGDIHLSMVQQVPLSYQGGGAVIVTTPSEVALLDARKCAVMFAKTHVPILGVIENMSWLEDASTGARLPIFGEGGGAQLADALHAPLLAQIPLSPELRAAGDAGQLAAHMQAHPQPWDSLQL